MAARAWRSHPGGVALDTRVVTPAPTRPRTGLPYLDAGLEQPGSVLALAHRGGAFHPGLEGLENTFAAFDHAVSLGFDYLETDVHVTRDGVLLALHDAVLDRVTDATGSVADLTYAEVAGAVVGGREQVPRLVDLLEAFPHARFNIDLKAAAAVAPLADLVERREDHDRVCVGAFSARRVRAFGRRVTREVAAAYAPAGVVAHRWLPAARRLTGDRGRVLQVPHRHRGVLVVTADFVARAHARGVPVHVWTVDEPEEMHHLLDLGVDGLFTDRTDLLREVLRSRGQWRETA